MGKLIALSSAVWLMTSAAAAQPASIKGEVTRLDAANSRVSIRHEPIPNLQMGAMNMVFRVANPSLIEGLKVGDQVIFEADRVEGAITVTKLEKAPAN